MKCIITKALALAACVSLGAMACEVVVEDDTPPDTVVYDADRDGLLDHDEVDFGTDPYVYDTDRDGLGDGEEVYDFDTDPLDWDTDGDGYGDGDEVLHGEDPLHW